MAGGESNPYLENITLKDGVALYGGFAGNEPPTFNLATRNFATNVTILDGNQASSVVTSPEGATLSTRIDGFTIRNGTASSGYGGGIYNSSGSPALTNCTFSGNSASYDGGTCNFYGSSMLSNCAFSGNTASDSGGGIWTSGGSSTTSPITGCTFTRNTAISSGGGIYNINGSPRLTNCSFNGNSAGSGGGMYNSDATSSPRLVNCLFSGNSATSSSGGGFYNDGGTPTIINCTLSGNSAQSNAGGVHNQGGNTTLKNGIVWGNSPYNIRGSATITYSCIQGGWTGKGNTSDDPRFVRNPSDGGDGWGDNPSTPDVDEGANDDYGDLKLQAGSPCIDAGRNADVPADTADLDNDGNTTELLPFDLAYMARFCDDPATADTGAGAPPIVDMGAYEYRPNLPPAIVSAVSRKTHAAAGEKDINVKASGAIECRQNGPAKVVVTFDQQIEQVSGTVNDVSVSSGTVSSLAINSSELTVTMSGATDAALLTIGFPGIKGTSGQMTAETLCFGVLVGDANGDGKVNVLDLLAIKNGVNKPLTVDNFRLDINIDGKINVLDLLAAKNNLNKAITGLCP